MFFFNNYILRECKIYKKRVCFVSWVVFIDSGLQTYSNFYTSCTNVKTQKRVLFLNIWRFFLLPFLPNICGHADICGCSSHPTNIDTGLDCAQMGALSEIIPKCSFLFKQLSCLTVSYTDAYSESLLFHAIIINVLIIRKYIYIYITQLY